MTRLVLWDIDGTLVDTAGVAGEAFLEAFQDVAGERAPPERLVPFAGRTDLEIALDLLHGAQVPNGEDRLGDFERALARALATHADTLRMRGRALPGAATALERVRGERDVLQSLLTGNIEPNARIKLAAFALDRLVDLEIGAYGSDHRRRGELVAVALAKARARRGVEVDPTDVVLIGDTPLDVTAAIEAGARAVGVATGPYTEDQLRASGAHAVLPDLTSPGAVVHAIFGA